LLDEGRQLKLGTTEDVLKEYDILCNEKSLVKNIKNDSGNGAKNIGLKEKKKTEKGEVPEELLFDHSLTPECTLFRKSKIDFDEFVILNLNGQKINILKTGQKYIIKAVFTFNEDLHDMMFSLRILTTKGYRACWMAYPFEKRKYFNAKKGDYKVFQFEFDCNLLDGVYLIDAGLQSFNDDELFTHISIHNVYSFKVSKADLMLSGLAFMNFILTED
jgi:hypothetical protein